MENFDLLPPSKLRMEKWHVLPFARLHSLFSGGWGSAFLFYSVHDCTTTLAQGRGGWLESQNLILIDTTNRRGKSCATTFIVQFQLSLKRNYLQAEDFYQVTPQTPQLTKTIYQQYLFYKGCVCFHAVSKRTVRNWQVQHRSGSIHYRRQHGTVQIQIAGFYYVYSQMYYYDGMAYQMTHQLYVNSRKFMQSTSAVISEEKKYSTNYNGGVVFLNSTDHISVRTPFSRVYKMDPGYSYFGAFLLHPTTN